MLTECTKTVTAMYENPEWKLGAPLTFKYKYKAVVAWISNEESTHTAMVVGKTMLLHAEKLEGFVKLQVSGE